MSSVRIKRNVIITTSFIAIHNWPECDVKGVEFLCYPHRHTFNVTLKFRVNHDDRDIEFIDKKKSVDELLSQRFQYRDLGRMSCEAIATTLLDYTGAFYCSVYEDNENGAEVYYE